MLPCEQSAAVLGCLEKRKRNIGSCAMIETTIPEIDVTELMKRVRAEAARINSVMSWNGGSQTSLSPLPPPPALSAPKNVDPRREKLESLLQQAKEKTEVLRIPKPFRRFFRKQGAFNRLLLEIAAAFIKTDAALNEVVRDLGRGLAAQNEWLKMNAEHLTSAQNQLWNVRQHIDAERSRVDALTDGLATVRAEGERAGEHLRNLQAEADRLGLNLRNLQSE